MASTCRGAQEALWAHHPRGLRFLGCVLSLSSSFQPRSPLIRSPSLAGDIERHTIPKSQGRQPYYDARKASWGDSFPHPPKNGPQPSPSTAPSPYDLLDDAAPRNKFGGDPKQRGKKAEREMGKRAARSLREDGRRARSAKRAGAKEGDDPFAGFARAASGADGVVDVQLDFGPDGQLRARR